MALIYGGGKVKGNLFFVSAETRKKSTIRIGYKDEPNEINFYIQDNGVGFDMNLAGNLFTPFHRLHSEEHFKGTGIGLATVKRVIVKHGGTIAAQSEPGKGTTFSFTL